MRQMVNWLTPSFAALHDRPGIATLGPAGTSSEVAAGVVWQSLDGTAPEMRNIELHRTYEDAAEALLNRDVNYLVVANAYSGISEFYMNTRLTLAGVFVMDTPHYGIARVPGRPVPERPVVATHPAPRPLVDELLPSGFTDREILQVTSTSMAAAAARDGITDLALTTRPAVEATGLEFISRTRVIRMLWSVFTTDDDAFTPLATETADVRRTTHAHA
ncbi:hypothetical protein ACSHWO_36570 (plasmid) [Streptomyces sp. HUAS TT3]|uniref:hypothetical protein n=1 Tax=unclassified Streptomyces TaxID=2593676 RepID=UPI0036AE876C